MADLFDMNVSGVGWHVPIAMVAVAALLIACFAITGYISFQDDSIPSAAMEDSDSDGVKDFKEDALFQKNLTVDGDFSAKVLAFQTGIAALAGIAPTSVTDGEVDGNLVALDNAFYESQWDGANNGSVTLPLANAGSLILWRQAVDADGAASQLTFTKNTADKFDTRQTIAIGSASDVGLIATPADNNTGFRITCDTTNGVWGRVGSTCSFYCASPGVWSVMVPTSIGKGSTGAGGIAFV